MTRSLILMRHAKSSWDGGEEDHARPLNARGREAAAALGRWLRARGPLPDRALVSTAARTRETFDRLGLEVPVRYEADLYHATAGEMLDVLRRAEGERVLMIGHNPGIGEVAARLVARPPDHPRFDAYPTGATLVCTLPADWPDTAFGTASPQDFTVPRDLA